MYKVVLFIQCISILALFAECWLVVRSFRGKVHFYLFLSFVATLINNIGYLMQLLSKSEEAYFTALKMSYLGRAWTAFALFLFITEFVKFRLPKFSKEILGFISAASYVIVVTTKQTGLYYKSTYFELSEGLPVFEHEDGIFHHFFTGMIVFYSVMGLAILIRAKLKEKKTFAGKRISMVILAVLTEGVFTIVEMLKLIPSVEKVYDITMIGYPIGSIFMFIAIVRYELLDTEILAREFIVEELSEGIIATDKYGEVKYFNKPVAGLFPELESEPEKIVALLKDHIETKEPIRMNGRIFTPGSNLLFQKKREVGCVYSIIDDTVQYQTMEALNEERRRANDANAAKTAFLTSMSHEIRTPINAVLGMDEMILRESREEDTLSYAHDIQTAGNTLLALINEILDFSKIEEGRMEILPSRYELSSVIFDLVNMIRIRADKKGLTFKLDVDENIPHLLYGDEIRIKQIISNLLTNAVKYTEKGGIELKLSYRKVSTDDILLIVKVSDTGIGMKPEDIEKMFAPFARIEEIRNRSIEGTGLGMSIVKQLLAMMSSKLEVKSEYGSGTEFSFELRQRVEKWVPIGDITEKYQPDKTLEYKYKELFHAPNARILVVDDMEINIEVIKRLLKKTEIQIDTAASGPEAIKLAEENDYDVIFIDHMMPEMDGIETLKRMQEKMKKIPVCVALTANAVMGAREMYLSAGFADYMSKPVVGKHLEELLKEYIPKEKVDSSFVEYEEEKQTDLPDIPGISVKDGVKFCGSEESFKSILNTFHRTYKQNSDKIKQYFDEEDWKNYTIKVHALKSSARIIGASGLSGIAARLEEAGKNGELDLIRQENGVLLKEYEELDKRLAFMDRDSDSLMEMTESMRKDAFNTIIEVAGDMDMGMMENIIKDLREYRLSEADIEAVKDIENRLMELDWDGIIETARKVI